MKVMFSLPLILCVFIAAGVITMVDGEKKLDLNSASCDQLEQLPGIGPSFAARIIHERDRRGGFRNVDDLLKVRGINRNLVKRLRPFVMIKPYRLKEPLVAAKN